MQIRRAVGRGGAGFRALCQRFDEKHVRLLLAASSLFASYAPGRRATSVNPLTALRQD